MPSLKPPSRALKSAHGIPISWQLFDDDEMKVKSMAAMTTTMNLTGRFSDDDDGAVDGGDDNDDELDEPFFDHDEDTLKPHDDELDGVGRSGCRGCWATN